MSYWVLRSAFNGIKGQGAFVCENTECNTQWTSNDTNKQACKSCGKRVLPMWVESKLEPPVDTPGYWVLRDEFNGVKSFGSYVCESKKCKNKKWISAHAYKIHRQGCKSCDQYTLPTYMWVNTDKDTIKDIKNDTDKDTDKPHDSERCEACKAGVCIRNGIEIQSVEIAMEPEPTSLLHLRHCSVVTTPSPIIRDDLDIKRNLLREKIKKSFL